MFLYDFVKMDVYPNSEKNSLQIRSKFLSWCIS